MKNNPLESFGMKVFQSLGKPISEFGDNSRYLSPEEFKRLKKIERIAIFKCALAGALSTIIAAIAAVYAEKWFVDVPTAEQSTLYYWLLFGGVTAIAALFEIAYLYIVCIKAAHQIAAVCDVYLIENPESDANLGLSLVRAAMEIPHPSDADAHVSPHRYASKWKLIGIAILYKAKILLTNALAKVIVRKTIARGVARAWLEFIAVPITALWNGIVTYWIVREARVRALGHLTVEAVLPSLNLNDVAEGAQRAVAVSVSSTAKIHPSHSLMLNWLRLSSGTTYTEQLDSAERFEQYFKTLSEKQKQAVLEVFALAIVIDGKVSKQEAAQYEHFSSITKSRPPVQLKEMLHEFINGKEITQLKKVGM